MAHDHDAWLRSLYAGRRANRVARRYARLWSAVFRLGLQPRRWVTLEVVGHATGERRQVPLGMADLDGRWYLVSMLGECAWVRNVRAADGNALLLRGRARRVHLLEVPVDDRARILQRYHDVVPGGRPHMHVERGAPLADFERIAADHPVFEVQDGR